MNSYDIENVDAGIELGEEDPYAQLASCMWT